MATTNWSWYFRAMRNSLDLSLLGQLIEAWRKTKRDDQGRRLTQAALATKLGMSTNGFTSMLRAGKPEWHTLGSLRAIGCDVDVAAVPPESREHRQLDILDAAITLTRTPAPGMAKALRLLRADYMRFLPGAPARVEWIDAWHVAMGDESERANAHARAADRAADRNRAAR